MFLGIKKCDYSVSFTLGYVIGESYLFLVFGKSSSMEEDGDSPIIYIRYQHPTFDDHKHSLLLWMLVAWTARNIFLLIGILTVTFYFVFGPFTVRVVRRREIEEPEEYEP